MVFNRGFLTSFPMIHNLWTLKWYFILFYLYFAHYFFNLADKMYLLLYWVTYVHYLPRLYIRVEIRTDINRSIHCRFNSLIMNKLTTTISDTIWIQQWYYGVQVRVFALSWCWFSWLFDKLLFVVCIYTGCPKKKDIVTLSHNFRLNYSNSKFRLHTHSYLQNYSSESNAVFCIMFEI